MTETMEIRMGVESTPHTSWIFQTPYHLRLSTLRLKFLVLYTLSKKFQHPEKSVWFLFTSCTPQVYLNQWKSSGLLASVFGRVGDSTVLLMIL